ncbi:MAG: universal stress protein [Deltaproteobacteria bacterium]|jgi:nucleotide-binding universal stress UspA family protein|nr:universal stress protein [Deltaproteobacteria bacterium]
MRVHFKKILCATDFSDFSNLTVSYGVALAKEFEASLIICHIIDLSSVAIYGEFQLDPIGQQNRIMEDASAQLEKLTGDQPVAWESLITVGKPADEISRAVEEKAIDLVITATRGRSGFKRLILGSVTERLMRTITCPLLVVRSPEREFVNIPQPEIKLNKILVGCDFSPDSDQAFEHGLSLAQEFQAELHLAHVIEPPAQPNLLVETITVTGEVPQNQQNLLIQKLKDMVPAEADNWCTPQTSILEGQPYEELVKYADTRDIDIIVLGVRGHGLVKTLFLGSTTDRIIRNSPCPVLSVSSKVQKEQQ